TSTSFQASTTTSDPATAPKTTTTSTPTSRKRKSQKTAKTDSSHDEASPLQTDTPPATSFAELGLKGWVLAQVAALDMRTPTPVQRACIPAVLSGRKTSYLHTKL